MPQRSLIGAIALAGWLAIGAVAHAQDMSKYPDWSGQWKKPDEIGNGQWDPTKPRGTGQQAPLTPQYKAIHDARIAERASGGLGGDPTAQCIPHGMPRMMIGVYPMELVVTPKATYMLSEYNEPRRIFTDGRAFPKEIEGTFNGYSIGKWIDETGEGRFNVLEVETRGFKGPRAFDSSGIPLHHDNQTIVKERIYRDGADRDVFHDEVTVIDHALTHPWTVNKRYRREAVSQPYWREVSCSENNNHLEIGKEAYMLSADGFLMPTKKDQPGPDLRYFKQTKR